MAETPIGRMDHYRLLGDSGLRVSPLCLGTMTFGTEWGWGADEATSRLIFDRYVEAGGNFLDTANFYTNGTSERMLGRFMADQRDRFVLATKYTLKLREGDPNAAGNARKCMFESVEGSLRRLGVDYIDLYWVHAYDLLTPIEEVMRGLDDLVRQGKVHYVAVSDFPAWKVAEANTLARFRGWSPFIATQVEYHLAKRDVERDIAPMARDLRLGLLPWSPLGAGVLTGKYDQRDMEREQELIRSGQAKPFDSDSRIVGLTEQKLQVAQTVREIAEEIGRSPAQVALNWLLCQPGVASIILGARKVEQLEDNLKCLEFTLDDDHLRRLDDVSAIDLGFPHTFLVGGMVGNFVTAGASIEGRPETPR